MHDTPRLHRVSSLFANLELLLAAQRPDQSAFRLGARWSFGWPRPETVLAEYSWPVSYLDALPGRSGIALHSHQGDAARVRQHVAEGGWAVVAVDSFHLPYRPAHGRVHSGRTIIVRPPAGGAAGAAGAHGAASIIDQWLPAYTGPLSWRALDRAMGSRVPLDPVREPLFSGHPIEGRWFSVDILPWPGQDDPGAWVIDILRTLLDEALADVQAATGLGAFARFIGWVGETFDPDAAAPAQRAAWRRHANLVLRAEISARVYLCVLLHRAARWLGNRALQAEARRLSRGIHELEQARDVLAKSVRREQPAYGPHVVERLRRGLAAELVLGRELAALLGVARDFSMIGRELPSLMDA